MKKNEKMLAARMLEMASDEFSNNGCNDVPNKVWKGWTKEERKAFVAEYHKWNKTPKEDIEPGDLDLPDWAIMDFLAHRLSK